MFHLSQTPTATVLDPPHTTMLIIVFVVHLITVAKSKMYYQGVKSTAFGVKSQS